MAVRTLRTGRRSWTGLMRPTVTRTVGCNGSTECRSGDVIRIEEMFVDGCPGKHIPVVTQH